MASSFTPDGTDPVTMLLRSRYLPDTLVEEIEAEVQPDPAECVTALLRVQAEHGRTLPGP